MIILDTTTRSLEFLLSGAVTTNQLPFVFYYVDHTAAAYTPLSQNGTSNNTTAVTVTTAPAASTQRSIKYGTIQNRDTTAKTLTVRYNDSGTTRDLLVVTLAVNDTLQYIDTDGFSVVDTSGQKKSLASVTGTVTANAGTNLNTSALALESGNIAAIAASSSVLDDWDETDRAKVNVIVGQAGVQGNTGAVSATTQRVTLATDVALPAGTNLLGRVSASNETSIVYNASTALTPKFAAIAAAASGDNTLIAAVAAKTIRILSLFIMAAGTVNMYFTSNAAGTVIFGGSTNKINLIANVGFVLPYSPIGWFQNSTTNQAIVVNLSAAIAISGGLTYIEV